ncbi:hypothetical protein CK203_073023 [Vitis vinifera]|uniref:Uncharacterized protein n=1 Tax=Vitis vinifera TaxID=29760 RepID=A0A438F1X2_VITVI|nr:hypothetical protein CK203_073023 [Vitis vinifera]
MVREFLRCPLVRSLPALVHSSSHEKPKFLLIRSHPALIGRHRPFPVTHQAAERHTAFFLVAGDELKNRNQGVPCKHGASKPAAV